ncbi:unnamed protein product [Rotaria sordida]|uniref:G-protein coupled receptors family 1 profile domain-containing protein n=1 Tax=Rotaria sordida TaxID=392033 RepID=A0A815FGX8_9BILA|nr:unnamed protein product [Rotaria sordida]CAF1589128.1 unnamed protein product [Rotaria sordida]
MPLMTIHSLYLHWPFHYRLCYIWMSIDFTCSTASFLTLASMALDRYWALTTPYFHLRNRSLSSVLIFIISSWAIPFAIWPSSILISHYYSKKEPICVHPAPPFIIVLLCTFFYYIPLLFMLACYSRIIINIKNIEVLIKDSCDTMNLNSSGHALKPSTMTTTSNYDGSARNDKSSNTTTVTTSISSIRTRFYKYFQRNRTINSVRKESLPANEKKFIIHEVVKNRKNSNEYHHNTNPKRRSIVVGQGRTSNVILAKTSSTSSLSSVPHHRLYRQPRTAAFKGQKRYFNDIIEDNRLKNDLIINHEEEQKLVQAYMNTYRLSLPATRYESCCYYQHSVPTQTIITKAIVENQHRNIINDHQYENSHPHSLPRQRSQSYSPSSIEYHGNGGIIAADGSRHDSSCDNSVDEEHRRLNSRTQQLCLSKTRNTSRYSRRAIAEFMHQRHQACLRRNQKASRMLGILLAVFLICWLPFTISYPTSIIYPNKFPSGLECIIFWFGYVNSLLNPFLYVYSSRNFRQAITETLCCHVRLQSQQRLRYQWSFRTAQK